MHAVDRAEVFDSQRLEDLAGPHGVLDAFAEHLPGALDRVNDGSGQLIDDALGKSLGLFVGRADAHALDVLGKCALRLADAHAVVIEHHQHLTAAGFNGRCSSLRMSRPFTIEASPTTANHMVIAAEVLICPEPFRRRC